MTIHEKLHQAAIIANSSFHQTANEIMKEAMEHWIKVMTFNMIEYTNPKTFQFIEEYKKGLNK